MPGDIHNYCGECALLLEEDFDGFGYCPLLPLFTSRHCGDPACEDFIIKNKDDEE